MNTPIVLNLQLASDPAALPEIRERLRDFCEHQQLPDPCVCDIVLAVDEALANVIRHGYEGRTDQPIDLDVRLVHDQSGCAIEIAVRDYGKQVDPASIRGRDLADIRPGGLGVHIIQRVMDSAEYSCPPDGGMRLVMRKYFSHAEGDSPAESS